MAVQRSIAFQNVRKSIGQTTYYRRAGVQLVRSKPTFAPGRTFTNAQLVQQRKMQVSQYVYNNMGLNDAVPYMNCQNNKRYNASSKYNRFISSALDCILPDWLNPSSPDPIDVVAVSESNIWDILAKMSVGNVQFPAVTAINWELSGTTASIKIVLPTSAEQALLNTCQKRLKSKQALTLMDFGAVLVIRDHQNTQTNYIGQPVMNNDEYLTPVYSFAFTIDGVSSIAAQRNIDVNIVLFCVKRFDETDIVPPSVPVLCTSNKIFENISYNQL
jgi:hypothetical protein